MIFYWQPKGSFLFIILINKDERQVFYIFTTSLQELGTLKLYQLQEKPQQIRSLLTHRQTSLNQ